MRALANFKPWFRHEIVEAELKSLVKEDNIDVWFARIKEKI